MLKIFKYPLKLTDIQAIEIPEKASILSVDIQNGGICLWALVDPNSKLVNYKFAIIGTGNPIDDSYNLQMFIGTVQQPPFVWHVFLL